MNYIIVTPVRNEDKSLPGLIDSVASQSIRPKLWVIVDDGSNDKTPLIIQAAKKNYEWIKSIHLGETPRDLGIHIANVIQTGLNLARDYCEEHSIEYDFIVFLDADMLISDTHFFDKLIIKFEDNKSLGIASGAIQIRDISGNSRDGKRRTDTISGGEMICRRQCVEDIGGIPITYFWDGVMRVKAILKGWEIRRFDEIKIIQTRDTYTAEGSKKGYYLAGTYEYYLNYNPVIIILKGLIYFIKRPHYTGLSYLSGYFNCWLRRKDKIDDKEIKNYYFWYKFREIGKYYFNNKHKIKEKNRFS